MQNSFTIRFVNSEQVRFMQQMPSIIVDMRCSLNNGTEQFEYRNMLLDTVILERNILLEHPLLRRGNMDTLKTEAKERTMEHFVIFLTNIARMRTLRNWEDLVLMLDPQVMSYYLLTSQSRYFEFRYEILNWGEEIAIHRRKIQLVSSHQIIGDDCYLIMPEQYTVYIYIHRQNTAVKVHMSPFIDLERRNFTPIKLKADNILNLLRENSSLYEESPANLTSPSDTGEYPLVKSPQYPIVSGKKAAPKFERCPICSGRIKYLSETDAFCLDCDWDNLVPLGK
ncbi:MAG: hypothetical protein ACE5PV_00440 [Candidatus Poribacteria bacterium]